jgi:aminoglycoside/choline kinase family phosphotransferase
MDDNLASAIAALVRRCWPGTTLSSLSRLTGDFSTRSYLRAELAGGGAPASAIIMVLAGSGLPLSSEELGVFAEPPRELPFLDVHRLLTAIGAPVPAIYLADVAAGLLLLEDGGDVLLWDRVRAAPAEAEALYQRAIDALLILHTRGSAHPDRTGIAFAQRFDTRLYLWELEHFLEYGVERRLGVSRGARARAAWRMSFDAIAAELSAAELVLSHRDFHSWNILMRGNAPLLIDFQDALLAPAEYDLASLLTDRITPRIVTPAMERRLLTYYWAERGTHPDAGRRRRYALTALHRALKVIGRIHYIAIEKGKQEPLAFQRDVVATVQRLLGEVPLAGGLAEQFAALPWPDDAVAGTEPS